MMMSLWDGKQKARLLGGPMDGKTVETKNGIDCITFPLVVDSLSLYQFFAAHYKRLSESNI